MARKLTAKQLLKVGYINNREAQILTELRRNGAASNRELSVNLGIPINSITPRTLSLRQMDLVVFKKYKYDATTNRTVRVWQSS